MVIIWRGLGFLVAVIVFACSLAANLILNATYGDGYYDHHKWPFALSLLVSAAICWFVGVNLRKSSDRLAIDKESGKEFVVNRPKHALFFIPMHLWGPILAVIAVILLGIELSH